MRAIPPPDLLVTLPDGRRLGLDDRGDPSGVPVVYLHGTPDSRLARHPDDGIATSAGVRLLAVDRPGVGASDPDPRATPRSVADDVVAALDHLDIDRAGLLAWSAGSISALALAGAHPDRIDSLVLVAPLVPADAYGDDGVLDGADDSRRLFADNLGSMAPDDLGRELAMWLVPPVIDDALARDMLERSLAEVEDVDGGAEQLVLGLRAAVTGDPVGVEREIAAQAMPLGELLDRIDAPTHVVVGDDDRTAPPPMGRWLADRLGAALDERAGAGHAVAITQWADHLRRARRRPSGSG